MRNAFMAIKVAKFGGTSLADASMIKQVKAIVEADAARRYVVPSAPGKRTKSDQKITDLLYLCLEHVVQQLPFEDVFKVIAERYLEMTRDLGLKLDMKAHLDEVRRRISAGDTADYAASRG